MESGWSARWPRCIAGCRSASWSSSAASPSSRSRLSKRDRRVARVVGGPAAGPALAGAHDHRRVDLPPDRLRGSVLRRPDHRLAVSVGARAVRRGTVRRGVLLGDSAGCAVSLRSAGRHLVGARADRGVRRRAGHHGDPGLAARHRHAGGIRPLAGIGQAAVCRHQRLLARSADPDRDARPAQPAAGWRHLPCGGRRAEALCHRLVPPRHRIRRLGRGRGVGRGDGGAVESAAVVGRAGCVPRISPPRRGGPP